MSIFENSFFSIEGQKERLGNVVDTLKAAVTGQGVQSNTGNKTADAVLSAAASNPFTTAAAGAVVAAPGAAAAALKAGFSALPASGKVATVIAAPVVAGAVIANPNIAKEAAKTPSKLSQFGSNIGEFSKNPSVDSATTIFKDNPILTSAAVIGTGIVVGKGASSLIATAANTSAIRKNTEAVASGNVGIPRVEDVTSKYDYKISENQTESQLALAKIQLKAQESAQSYNLKVAELQSKSATATAISSPNVIAEPSPTPKKTTKKKKKSTKKAAPKKKKTVKKKAQKKKKTTKKATKR